MHVSSKWPLALLVAGLFVIQGCGGSGGGGDDAPPPPVIPPIDEPENPDFRIEFPEGATQFDDFERRIEESLAPGLGGLWVIYSKQQWAYEIDGTKYTRDVNLSFALFSIVESDVGGVQTLSVTECTGNRFATSASVVDGKFPVEFSSATMPVDIWKNILSPLFPENTFTNEGFRALALQGHVLAITEISFAEEQTFEGVGVPAATVTLTIRAKKLRPFTFDGQLGSNSINNQAAVEGRCYSYYRGGVVGHDASTNEEVLVEESELLRLDESYFSTLVPRNDNQMIGVVLDRSYRKVDTIEDREEESYVEKVGFNNYPDLATLTTTFNPDGLIESSAYFQGTHYADVFGVVLDRSDWPNITLEFSNESSEGISAGLFDISVF